MERKQPDIIIPDIHFARISDKQGDSGNFRLMLEIFRDGLLSAMSWKRQEDRWDELTEEEKDIVLEALAWVIEGPTSSYCSFEALCDLMGVDSDYIRDQVLRSLSLTVMEVVKILYKNGWTI